MKKIFPIATLFAISSLFGLENWEQKYLHPVPFLPYPIKPLVVIDMDYSENMLLPAHYKIDLYGNLEIVSYNSSETYYGYFDTNAYYKYDFNNQEWIKINRTCPQNNGIGYIDFQNNDTCLSGNFLNWLTTTRINVAYKALVGGLKCGDNNEYLCSIARSDGYQIEEENTGCEFQIYGNKTADPKYLQYFQIINPESCRLVLNSSENANKTAFYVQLKITDEFKPGILKQVFDKVDITFMSFSSNTECRKDSKNYPAGVGKIWYAFYEHDYSKLEQAITSITPGGYACTGESLWEVYDYLKQEEKNLHSYEDNDDYIERKSEKDPYYIEINDKDKFKPIPCRKTYVLLISDGEWNGDVDPAKVAHTLHTEDLRNETDLPGKQIAGIYTLYTFSDSDDGRNALATTAACGSFIDLNGNNEPDGLNGSCENIDSREESFPKSECENTCGSCKEWDGIFYKTCDGYPDAFFYAKNGQELEQALTKIFQNILNLSGSAVSIPSPQKGRAGAGYYGSVVAQPTFQETYAAENTLHWVGHIYNWWYWSNKNTSNLREDNVDPFTLDATGEDTDNIIEWHFDTEKNQLVVEVCKANPDGTKSNDCTYYSNYENTHPIVDFGKKLQEMPASQRKIYVNINNQLRPIDDILDLPPQEQKRRFGNNTDVKNLIEWIKGKDLPQEFRVRTPSGDITDDGTGVWKLGDIIHSRPVLVNYGDYIVAFIGSNDGMLHAFRLGYIKNNYKYEKPISLQNAKNDSGTSLIGRELWSFIPTHVLPYMRIFADKEYGTLYNHHLAQVDLSPYVVSIKESNGEVRRILIGGLRFGGATGFTNDDDDNEGGAINPPPDTCPALANADDDDENIDLSNCYGLSEYFALDITDPTNPKLLWEFTDRYLGFSYSGPGIIRKGDKTYVVFLSGPVNYNATIPDDVDDDEVTLKLYILDLETGQPVYFNRDDDNPVPYLDTEIEDAFGGRLFGEGYDYNGDGKTDYLAFGYSVGEDPEPDDWTGGLMVLNATADDPHQWRLINIEQIVIAQRDENGEIDTEDYKLAPITARVLIGKCRGKPYILFGTGRWFYKLDNLDGLKDLGYRNIIMGYDFDKLLQQCAEEIGDNQIGTCKLGNEKEYGYAYDVTDYVNGTNSNEIKTAEVPASGWVIRLAPADSAKHLLNEKVITDPSLIEDRCVALFTTSIPEDSLCSVSGGYTNFWAVDLSTGGAINNRQAQGLEVTTQTSVSQVIKLGLKKFVEKKTRVLKGQEEGYHGIAPETASSVIRLSPLVSKGQILLWLEY